MLPRLLATLDEITSRDRLPPQVLIAALMFGMAAALIAEAQSASAPAPPTVTVVGPCVVPAPSVPVMVICAPAPVADGLMFENSAGYCVQRLFRLPLPPPPVTPPTLSNAERMLPP